MSRPGIAWACVILIAGALSVAWWADQQARRRDPAPAGQNQVVTDNSQCPPRCTKEAELARARALYPMTYDLQTRQPIYGVITGDTTWESPESLAHLQFLADGVRCPVSDRSAIMASCVAQRYHKMRDKALSARARYDALVGLERAYWAALAREGLTQKVEHVPVHP